MSNYGGYIDPDQPRKRWPLSAKETGWLVAIVVVGGLMLVGAFAPERPSPYQQLPRLTTYTDWVAACRNVTDYPGPSNCIQSFEFYHRLCSTDATAPYCNRSRPYTPEDQCEDDSATVADYRQCMDGYADRENRYTDYGE